MTSTCATAQCPNMAVSQDKGDSRWYCEHCFEEWEAIYQRKPQRRMREPRAVAGEEGPPSRVGGVSDGSGLLGRVAGTWEVRFSSSAHRLCQELPSNLYTKQYRARKYQKPAHEQPEELLEYVRLAQTETRLLLVLIQRYPSLIVAISVRFWRSLHYRWLGASQQDQLLYRVQHYNGGGKHQQVSSPMETLRAKLLLHHPAGKRTSSLGVEGLAHCGNLRAATKQHFALPTPHTAPARSSRVQDDIVIFLLGAVSQNQLDVVDSVLQGESWLACGRGYNLVKSSSLGGFLTSPLVAAVHSHLIGLPMVQMLTRHGAQMGESSLMSLWNAVKFSTGEVVRFLVSSSGPQGEEPPNGVLIDEVTQSTCRSTILHSAVNGTIDVAEKLQMILPILAACPKIHLDGYMRCEEEMESYDTPLGCAVAQLAKQTSKSVTDSSSSRSVEPRAEMQQMRLEALALMLEYGIDNKWNPEEAANELRRTKLGIDHLTANPQAQRTRSHECLWAAVPNLVACVEKWMVLIEVLVTNSSNS